MAAPIEIIGLAEFQRELRRLDAQFPKELRIANKMAAELIAEPTRSSFESRDGVAPKVAASVKVLAQQRSAAVKIGGTRFPYAMGSNFGSRKFTQFPPPVEPDYSLYRTIAANREAVVDTYADMVDRIARHAFPQ